MKKLILLIDSYRGLAKLYVEALQEAGYEVLHISTADEAVRFLKETSLEPAVCILDIAFPRGTFFTDEETNLGMKTGLLLMPKVRERFPAAKVFFLTDFPPVAGVDASIEVVRKIYETPTNLVFRVQHLLAA